LDQKQATEALAERLAILLAANRDWGDDVTWGQDFALPSSLDAYHAFVAGANVAGGWGWGSLAEYDKAIELSPGWPLAIVWQAGVLNYSGDGDRADSALSRLLANRRLLPGDRAVASGFLAWFRGEWERYYASVQDLYRLAPRTFAWDGCNAAMFNARPEEAVRYIRNHLQDTTFWTAPSRRTPDLRFCLSRALHALGKHQEELTNALAMRREFPERLTEYVTGEIEARAGLNQTAEVERLIDESEGFESARPGFSSSRALIAGWELRAHGDSAAARRAFARAAAWHRQKLHAGDTTFVRVGDLIYALTQAGTLDEAKAMLHLSARLAGTLADSAAVILSQGMLEARTGNRMATRDAIRRYDRLKLPTPKAPDHSPPYLIGQLYAAIADTANAIARFREAAAMGDQALRLHTYWHREVDAYMQRLPAFRQLVLAGR
jgi:hypothetical protein